MIELERPSRNIGLDVVRVTETAALAAGRWVGSGDYVAAHRAATRAMRAALDTLAMDGRIVIGEENRLGEDLHLCGGETVGTGDGLQVDLVVDPIDGTNMLIQGQPGAVSVLGVAPRDTLFSPIPAEYMNKLVVDKEAAKAIVPECLDAPAAWTLALIARVKQKAVRDLSVIVLDRPRNEDLVEEIRSTGARVLLRQEGDAEGALIAASGGTGVDALMGIGGTAQGIMAALVVKALGGAMLARVAPQSDAESQAIRESDLDLSKIYTCHDLVKSNRIFFAATGITNTHLLSAMQFHREYASTHSLLIRSETGTRRYIHAEHYARI